MTKFRVKWISGNVWKNQIFDLPEIPEVLPIGQKEYYLFKASRIMENSDKEPNMFYPTYLMVETSIFPIEPSFIEKTVYQFLVGAKDGSYKGSLDEDRDKAKEKLDDIIQMNKWITDEEKKKNIQFIQTKMEIDDKNMLVTVNHGKGQFILTPETTKVLRKTRFIRELAKLTMERNDYIKLGLVALVAVVITALTVCIPFLLHISNLNAQIASLINPVVIE